MFKIYKKYKKIDIEYLLYYQISLFGLFCFLDLHVAYLLILHMMDFSRWIFQEHIFEGSYYEKDRGDGILNFFIR